jgi:hypothetical protein
MDQELNQSQLEQLQIKRNYIQMDRDMVEKFFLNTRAERLEIERKIVNKEAEVISLFVFALFSLGLELRVEPQERN